MSRVPLSKVKTTDIPEIKMLTQFRRVKCDLKDLSMNNDPDADISCTNCRERGIRCKDDYADSKKQLRRGKRINQLELE
jgi:hypothetical protein